MGCLAYGAAKGVLYTVVMLFDLSERGWVSRCKLRCKMLNCENCRACGPQLLLCALQRCMQYAARVTDSVVRYPCMASAPSELSRLSAH